MIVIIWRIEFDYSDDNNEIKELESPSQKSTNKSI